MERFHPLDKYRVTIAGRIYIEQGAIRLKDGLIILDIFGPKYFKPGEYERLPYLPEPVFNQETDSE